MKQPRIEKLVIYLFIMVSINGWAAEEMIFAARENSRPALLGTPYLQCAMKQLNITISIVRVPWKRAQIGTKTGKYQGFIFGTQNASRDQYATFFPTELRLKWYYLVKKHPSISLQDINSSELRLGALAGSSMERWGQENHGDVLGRDNIVSMIKMLNRTRLDVVLLNNHQIDNLMLSEKLNLNKYTLYEIKSLPMGIYIGNLYLNKNPWLANSLPKQIQTCNEIL